MKQKIFSLLVLLVAATGAWADELTVHDGTTTNNFVPIYGFYADAYNKCEMVMPASELSAMNGSEISAMTFYASQTSVSWGVASFTVFLKEVSEATISGFSGPGTVVYEGALSIVAGEMTVTFTTPYTYNGGNLLIGVYNTPGGYVTSTWYGETVTGASVHGYDYNSLAGANPSQKNFLPKTTFTYSAPEPAGPEVTTNAASEGATFTTASFEMPTYDVTVDYEIVRDMTVDVDATIADRIRIKKENNAYVAVTATELVPVITDALDEQNPVIMVLYDETAKTGDYTVVLQKKVEADTPSWADATALSVGTFRYVITGAGLYDGEITTNEFQLFEGYEVTIPAGEYITYYRDEPLKLDNNETNAELYTISAVGTETATLSGPYDAMKALTPMLVHNKNTEEAKTILLIPCNEPDLALTVAPEFKGTLTASTITASTDNVSNYALNGKQFVIVRSNLEIGANKCWLSVEATSGARAINLVFDDATRIDGVIRANDLNGDYYDLNGRKLQGIPTRKGIYIKNGKKVVVK